MSQPVPEMECFMAEKVLEVNQIKANIEEKEILHGVDLSVGAGEVGTCPDGTERRGQIDARKRPDGKPAISDHGRSDLI